jgi:hypothetical protein
MATEKKKEDAAIMIAAGVTSRLDPESGEKKWGIMPVTVQQLSVTESESAREQCKSDGRRHGLEVLRHGAVLAPVTRRSDVDGLAAWCRARRVTDTGDGEK